MNPPVHAWAADGLQDRQEADRHRRPDFLERIFHKLLLNFTWWVNRKDAEGRNIFQGGFLGSTTSASSIAATLLPTGGSIEQSDGTSWMAMYTLNLLAIATRISPSRSALTKMWPANSGSTLSTSRMR